MKYFIVSVILLAACNKQVDKKPIPEAKSKTPYFETDHNCEFPGGWPNLDAYIKQNWKWIEPKDTIDGNVFVKFKIEKNGAIANVEIFKGGFCKSCDQEAIRLVRAMPKWKPTIKNGKMMDDEFILRIYFQSSTIR